jgi:hypothetical protein
MTNTLKSAPATTHTHKLALHAIGETAENCEEWFGSYAEAENELAEFTLADNLYSLAHPDGGWMLHCRDSHQVEYAALIVTL